MDEKSDMCSFKLKGYEVFCDKEDFELLTESNLYESSVSGYKQINYKGNVFARIIMNVYDPNIFVDHINGDELDNRKCNLRLSTKHQNTMNHKISDNNKSGITGIVKEKTGTAKNGVEYYAWRAMIGCPTGRSKSDYFEKKMFKSLHDAITWRYNKEKEIFGEYSRLCSEKTLEQILNETENITFENGHNMIVKCEKCSKEFTQKDINKHLKSCGNGYYEKRECVCGYSGDKGKLKRHILGCKPKDNNLTGCVFKQVIMDNVDPKH